MTSFEPDDDLPYRHPMSRRIVAGVAIVALVLSAIGVGIEIARAQWGPAGSPDQRSTAPVVPA